MERYSNGPDCVKRKLEVISKKLTQKTDPTEGIPHMFGNGGLNTSIGSPLASTTHQNGRVNPSFGKF